MSKILVLFLSATTVAFAGNTSPKIIYGEDNRQEISEVRDWKAKLAAKSVAARVYKRSFDVFATEAHFSGAPLLSDPFGAAVCSDEKFADQVTLSDCSGFLVGEDLLVTAGHCVMGADGEIRNQKTMDCSEYSWMFDYVSKDGKSQAYGIDASTLYSCEEVIYGRMDDEADFALIKLDRKVEGRAPLKIRTKGKVKLGQKLFVIGSPSGLPLKYAEDAKVLGNSEKDYFSTNMDTFGGNSGSPVFNAQTYEVEGILVRGRTDYVDSHLNGEYCRRVNVCDQERGNCLALDRDIDGEHANRMDEIVKYIK